MVAASNVCRNCVCWYTMFNAEQVDEETYRQTEIEMDSIEIQQRSLRRDRWKYTEMDKDRGRGRDRDRSIDQRNRQIHIWRFPKSQGYPQIIHLNRIFPNITHPATGVPPFVETPICRQEVGWWIPDFQVTAQLFTIMQGTKGRSAVRLWDDPRGSKKSQVSGLRQLTMPFPVSTSSFQTSSTQKSNKLTLGTLAFLVLQNMKSVHLWLDPR